MPPEANSLEAKVAALRGELRTSVASLAGRIDEQKALLDGRITEVATVLRAHHEQVKGFEATVTNWQEAMTKNHEALADRMRAIEKWQVGWVVGLGILVVVIQLVLRVPALLAYLSSG